MKRAVFLCLLIFICLAADRAALGQSNAKPEARPDVKPEAKKVCPFSIVGLWKSDATTEMNPIFYSFSPEGWVTLLGHSADTLPQDFEMITEVRYKLDQPAAPKSIEFTADRGNDTFQRGITLMDITEYSSDSFTTNDPASAHQTRWERVQTHRYFLTFAARSGPPPHGGPAFAMLIMMDGRKVEIDALGIHLTKDDADKTTPVFGQIPAELYGKITEESEKEKKSNKDESVIMRFELTQAEFESIHKTYETWNKYVKSGALPSADPYINGMEFLGKLAESLNQCGEKVKLHRLSRPERDEIASKYTRPQHPLEYIKLTRKKNDELHISNTMVPWQWRPVIQVQGQ